jgi:hypothetical protein
LLAPHPKPNVPKQRNICVAPPARQTCWLSNESPALNFTSGQIQTLLSRRGAAMTAHKTSTTYYVSRLVAPWPASACKTVVRHQAVLAPCIWHPLTPCSTQLRSSMDRSQPRWFSSVLSIATIGRQATLKMHS